MPNHLVNESSPYLRQHLDNPVDWYPWGEEALKLAAEHDKPILLSIGYAACHWCHVMAHESFEDTTTAEFMNRHFVNIKVDREERPDLDGVYMSAVQAMTGQGGWPMTVFLTPAGKPFYGGTYFPPSPRYGMPSFMQVLLGVSQAWMNQRDEISANAEKVTEHLARTIRLNATNDRDLDRDILARALAGIEDAFDAANGGFSPSPKFPQPMTLEFLLQMHHATGDENALQMVEHTLTKMAHGGIFDHIGGGFARYSTDTRWLVPHFEKMLYDNGLLVRVYLHAWQVTERPLFRQMVEDTLNFVAREMTHADGGFFSSFDADSEGEEGKFYVWSAEEIDDLLGDDAELFKRFYGVTADGNWEGKNIIHIAYELTIIAEELRLSPAAVNAKLIAARSLLRTARAKRVPPGLDNKVLTSWNALMLAAFADAGRVLDRPDYVHVAEANARFLKRVMRKADGRLLRSWTEGSEATHNAYLEDYAFLADALLVLYQATFDTEWFIWSREIVDLMLTHFSDQDDGGFFDTSDDHERLIHRPKEVQDNAIPSGNSLAATVLLRVGLYTGHDLYWEAAVAAIASLQTLMVRHPTAFGQWLCAAAFALFRPLEIAIAGDVADADARELLNVVLKPYEPFLVVAAGEGGDAVPLLHNRDKLNGRAAAYVCRNFVCNAPTTESDQLRRILREAQHAS